MIAYQFCFWKPVSESRIDLGRRTLIMIEVRSKKNTCHYDNVKKFSFPTVLPVPVVSKY